MAYALDDLSNVSDADFRSRAGSAIGNLLTPIQFGAVGDGVTDDTAALITAAAAANAAGAVLFGLGKTYKITSNLTAWARSAADFIIDMTSVTTAVSPWSGASARIYGLVCKGVDHFAPGYSNTSLASPAARYDESIIVASGAQAGFAAGDLILIYENAPWGAANAVRSEYAVVLSVAPGAINLSQPLEGNYSASANIRVCGNTEASQQNMKFIGSGDSVHPQIGMAVGYHRRVLLNNILSIATCHAGLNVSACALVAGGAIRAERLQGNNGYGIAVGGCSNVNISTVSGDDCRHVVTHGVGPHGEVNRNLSYGSITGWNMRDATLDGHPGVADASVGQVIHHGTIVNEDVGDAVIWQGSRIQIGRVVADGLGRDCVSIQPYGDGDGVEGWVSVDCIVCRTTSTGGHAFKYDDSQASANGPYPAMSTIRVGHIDSTSARGVYVYANRYDVNRVILAGGSVTTLSTATTSPQPHGVYFRMATGRVKVIDINALKVTTPQVSALRAIRIQGLSGAVVDRARLRGCDLEGGGYCLGVDYASVLVDDPTYTGALSGSTIVGTGGTINTVTIV